MPKRRHVLLLFSALPAVSLLGCGSDEETAAADCAPEAIDDDRECELCGMTVVRHEGPKGQACLRDGRTLVFCSVHDMLSWAWQPESAPAIAALFVHDLSRTGWEEPGDAWTKAEDAVYVVGHDRRAAMGHSPGPFSAHDDAEAFAREHGGRMVSFSEMDWDMLRDAAGNGDGGGHGDGDHGH